MACPQELQDYDESSEVAVAIGERVQCLELVMRNSCSKPRHVPRWPMDSRPCRCSAVPPMARHRHPHGWHHERHRAHLVAEWACCARTCDRDDPAGVENDPASSSRQDATIVRQPCDHAPRRVPVRLAGLPATPSSPWTSTSAKPGTLSHDAAFRPIHGAWWRIPVMVHAYLAVGVLDVSLSRAAGQQARSDMTDWL